MTSRMNKMFSKFSKQKCYYLKIYFSSLLKQQNKTFICTLKRYKLSKKIFWAMMDI